MESRKFIPYPEPEYVEPETKTKLFIDVDGVLFGVYGGTLQLRPFVNSFLQWAQKKFDCYFLTGWPEEMIRSFLTVSYLDTTSIQYAYWGEYKTEAIEELAPDGDFFWIDDECIRQEAEVLHKHGWQEKWIEVSMEGIEPLERTIRILCHKMKFALPDFLMKPL